MALCPIFPRPRPVLPDHILCSLVSCPPCPPVNGSASLSLFPLFYFCLCVFFTCEVHSSVPHHLNSSYTVLLKPTRKTEQWGAKPPAAVAVWAWQEAQAFLLSMSPLTSSPPHTQKQTLCFLTEVSRSTHNIQSSGCG